MFLCSSLIYGHPSRKVRRENMFCLIPVWMACNCCSTNKSPREKGFWTIHTAAETDQAYQTPHVREAAVPGGSYPRFTYWMSSPSSSKLRGTNTPASFKAWFLATAVSEAWLAQAPAWPNCTWKAKESGVTGLVNPRGGTKAPGKWQHSL